MSAGASGFFGKIPARGDFVRSGLPGGFVAAWDAWLQAVIPVSRELLGEDWVPAWLEAPIWRFALDHGLCGADAVLGVWMPSVDRAGRHFPLTLAATISATTSDDLPVQGSEWLAIAERAGLEAVTEDVQPERLTALLDTAPFPGGEGAPSTASPHERGDAADVPDFLAAPARGNGESGAMSRWWTEGAPRVAPRTLAIPGLPDGSTFAAMLDDRISGASQ